MTESPNVEIVRRALEAWNRRDEDAMQVLFHPDFEYHGLAEWPGLDPVYSGAQRSLTRQTGVDAEFDDFQARPVELIDVGERVVCILEMTATGKQSRVPVRFEEAAVVTVRDGRLLRIDVCESRAAALEAGAQAQ